SREPYFAFGFGAPAFTGVGSWTVFRIKNGFESGYACKIFEIQFGSAIFLKLWEN
ncbi:hypothetical protein Dsin_031370, partial [Dipteronia sinensis]